MSATILFDLKIQTCAQQIQTKVIQQSTYFFIIQSIFVPPAPTLVGVYKKSTLGKGWTQDYKHVQLKLHCWCCITGQYTTSFLHTCCFKWSNTNVYTGNERVKLKMTYLIIYPILMERGSLFEFMVILIMLMIKQLEDQELASSIITKNSLIY